MLPKRFISFLLSIFIFLLLTFSTSHSQHQVKKRLVVANASNLETITSVNVEIYHDVPTVAETDTTRLWFLRRRKMMSKGVLSKSKVVESEDRNGNNAKGSTTKKKAHCMIGKCNHVKGQEILNVKHDFSKRNDSYVKVKMHDFVPMNADYHYPISHPPKNN
ncbi:PREDICTED: uncharacterized protein LOC109342626 [Lupinus angustifolius]|uniref:uncharacterized protein LOC109342626 n=1 Tax=Lupinus angustifolius TaxID=3871 RepID=UPI00092F3A8F|nr:PREDICTED: uncharacterized protein LOC109342626 [Lupinus angustifolius]